MLSKFRTVLYGQKKNFFVIDKTEFGAILNEKLVIFYDSNRLKMYFSNDFLNYFWFWS